MINFISNLPADLRSGGFSAMNVAALEALRGVGEVAYIGPVNPVVDAWPKALSKLRRTAGGRGTFAFFSRQRLERIAREVERRVPAGDARMDFYHGFTPWILTRPVRPYIAWSDCTFRDYVSIFHSRDSFAASDLGRIEQSEAEWLRGAVKVLFTSEWARARAVADYDLAPQRTACVGIFGEASTPDRDAFPGGKQFAFVSTDFDAKGGRVALAALERARRWDPALSLIVVGDWPKRLPVPAGVEVVGFLRKEDPHQREYLERVLATSRALLLPTGRDITPLLIVEAGYFGTPAIAPSAFAIPELVEHQRSGLLLEDATSVDEVAAAMMFMLEDAGRYRELRAGAWRKTRADHTRELFDRRMAAAVNDVLNVEARA